MTTLNGALYTAFRLGSKSQEWQNEGTDDRIKTEHRCDRSRATEVASPANLQVNKKKSNLNWLRTHERTNETTTTQ